MLRNVFLKEQFYQQNIIYDKIQYKDSLIGQVVLFRKNLNNEYI